MKKALFTILLACVLGLNIYTLAKVTTFTQKEQGYYHSSQRSLAIKYYWKDISWKNLIESY